MGREGTDCTPRHTEDSLNVADGKIYAFGGWNGDGVSVSESYDPLTNSWTQLEPMTSARGAIATTLVNNKIYLIGGAYSGNSLSSVAIYDIETNSWSNGPELPAALRDAVAIISMIRFTCLAGTVVLGG